MVLRGRVSGQPQQRELPSGDEIVTFRLVVDRPDPGRSGRRTGPRQVPQDKERPAGQRVDTLDLVCWTARLRGQAARLETGDVVTVEGSVRRRFWRAGAAVQSRVEIEVGRLAVVARAKVAASAPV